jgi:hypothetical protein
LAALSVRSVDESGLEGFVAGDVGHADFDGNCWSCDLGE